MPFDTPIEISGTTYLLRFNNAAVEFFESVRKRSFYDAFATPMASDEVPLFMAGAKHHHPDIDLAKARALVDAVEEYGQFRQELLAAAGTYITRKPVPGTDAKKKTSGSNSQTDELTGADSELSVTRS